MAIVRKLALGSVLVAALTCIALSASAQTQPEFRPVYQTGPQNVFAPGYNPYQLQSESAQVAKQYVEAKESDKTEIRKHLTEVLSQQFDQHVKEQQQELDDLEKQIAHLKAVLRKRLDAKSTIIERRAEQLIQDAAGLGWNAPGSPHATPEGGFYYWGNKPKGAAPKTATAPQPKQ